jgi:hypothetical protein
MTQNSSSTGKISAFPEQVDAAGKISTFPNKFMLQDDL